MDNDSLLKKISSNNVLKQVFSYLEYKHFFSLIKCNKQLQNDLQINFKKNIYQNKYIEKIEENKLQNKIGQNYQLFKNGIIFGLHYLYFVINYLINIALFIKLDNSLYNFNNKYWKIITNIFFRIFSIFFHFFSMFVIFHILFYYNCDYTNIKKIFIFLILIVICAHCWYQIGLIHKIKLIYYYALNYKWIIFFDTIYFIVNLSYIICSIYFAFGYLYNKTIMRYIKIYILTLYRNIKIKEFKFMKNFDSIEEENKYFSSLVNNFEINYSENDLDLIDSINDYRLNNNLIELTIDKNIPEFIIKGNTELFLSLSNIIKLSNMKYLIKFNTNNVDFENIKKNRNIIDILIKPFFNKINITQQGDNKYVTIYEDLDEKNYETIKIKDIFENENSYLKGLN